MRAILTSSLASATLAIASAFTPASADNASIFFLRETEGLSNGRFPAMRQVDCVVPYCIHNPDGSLNHEKSTEALERAQKYSR